MPSLEVRLVATMADENATGGLDWQSSDTVEQRIKVTAVGDTKVGKTCMFMTFATAKFPDSSVPSLYENSTIKSQYALFPCIYNIVCVWTLRLGFFYISRSICNWNQTFMNLND